MARALELARRAEGHTSPNPMVGAVIVKDGTIISEGYHRMAGGPHAEIDALRACRCSPKGATLFVTLEPCCFFGRTPPCTQAIIDAGLKEVYYAVPDPNPKVSGKSHDMLIAAGISVVRGPLEREAAFLNRAFFHYIKTGMPYVTAKIAQSLDGKTATKTGHSQWITGNDARCSGHRLRHRCDAIMVGSGTVLADNPRLTTRLDEGTPRHPIRVVLDRRGITPLTHHAFQPRMPSKTWVFTTSDMPEQRRQELTQRGIDCHSCSLDASGRLALVEVLKELGKREIMTLLVEGGSALLGAMTAQRLVQEFWHFISPQIIGGQNALSSVGDPGFETLDQTLRLIWYDIGFCGKDLLLKGVSQDAHVALPEHPLPFSGATENGA